MYIPTAVRLKWCWPTFHSHRRVKWKENSEVGGLITKSWRDDILNYGACLSLVDMGYTLVGQNCVLLLPRGGKKKKKKEKQNGKPIWQCDCVESRQRHSKAGRTLSDSLWASFFQPLWQVKKRENVNEITIRIFKMGDDNITLNAAYEGRRKKIPGGLKPTQVFWCVKHKES